jgi:hypothetical protein
MGDAGDDGVATVLSAARLPRRPRARADDLWGRTLQAGGIPPISPGQIIDRPMPGGPH